MSKGKDILDVTEINTQKEPSFTKQQLIKSKKYQHQTDLLNVILTDDKQYTIKEVEKLINDFMNRKVKN